MEYVHGRRHVQLHVLLVRGDSEDFAMDRRSHIIVEREQHVRLVVRIHADDFIAERVSRRNCGELDTEFNTFECRNLDAIRSIHVVPDRIGPGSCRYRLIDLEATLSGRHSRSNRERFRRAAVCTRSGPHSIQLVNGLTRINAILKRTECTDIELFNRRAAVRIERPARQAGIGTSQDIERLQFHFFSSSEPATLY